LDQAGVDSVRGVVRNLGRFSLVPHSMQKRAVISALAASAAFFLGSLDAWAQPAPRPPPPPAAAAPQKPPAGEPPHASGEPTPGEAEVAPDSADALPSEAGEAEAGGSEPRNARPAPARPTAPTVSTVPPLVGAEPLEHREERKEKAARAAKSSERVWAEDWWSHARPVFELHGYYRLRTELFDRFALGRVNGPDYQLFATPSDNGYFGVNNAQFGPVLCTAGEGAIGTTNPTTGLSPCRNQTNAGANMRFRLNPELHISDNLRILSQIDLLDTVLGSTPEGYSIQPDAGGGYRVVKRNAYNALGVYDMSQVPPTSGINGIRNSIAVQRVWAEYSTPVGELRFGRMPSHWGLGILMNSGDGFDDDYQNNVDRIMFVTGIKPLDIYLAGAWDFVNEGPNSGILGSSRGQPYDLGQLDDVDEYMLSVVRRQNPALVEQALSQGKVVVNGGAYMLYRHQMIANDAATSAAQGGWVPNASLTNLTGIPDGSYVRRHANIWIPDLWFQLKYNKFRFEVEAVTVQGSIGNTLNQGSNSSAAANGWKLRQYGIATETEFKAVEDKLKLMFKFGWASGDPNATNLDPSAGRYTSTGAPGGIIPGNIGIDGLPPQLGGDKIGTFRFNPNYKVDLILNRNILSRIQGTYYIRPSVEYDFMRNPLGQRLGGGFAAIWTRASEFVQTPGHRRDLGIELNGKVYFQSKDGALNDMLGTMGGFYTQLEYGVLFPMGGLGYQTQEATQLKQLYTSASADTKVAQAVRWYLGVLF
jgi:uncharacterized protein (TIGR04551 family)